MFNFRNRFVQKNQPPTFNPKFKEDPRIYQYMSHAAIMPLCNFIVNTEYCLKQEAMVQIFYSCFACMLWYVMLVFQVAFTVCNRIMFPPC